MKKLLLFSVAVMISFNMTAQKRALVPSNFRNISLKKPVHLQKEYTSVQGKAPYLLKSTKAMSELEIGTTQYDLPSNSTVDHRCYLYSDGTIGTTYTLGNSPTAFPDRGTGYVYYDGSAWDGPPTARIEDHKTGWPSYSHLGVNNEGEVVIAHDGTVLVMNTRPTKGTGAWTQSLIPTPTGTTPIWPRIAVFGNTIHVLAAHQGPSQGGPIYQGQINSVLYYRSQDAGATWGIQAQILPGLDSASGYTQGYGGDVYSWAEPQGNTIAFVVGDNWTDLSLMKSTDGGNTWTKTIIFLHPYFNFNEATTLTPDTPYVCDGAHAVALDASGNAHVVFGIMRVLNDDTTDAASSWFPVTDGIAYWKEGDPTFTNLNPDSVDTTKIVGYVQDLDGSGYILDNLTDISQIPNYYLSCSSMPQLSIDQTNGDIYLVYKSFVENMQSAGGTGQFYSHLWGRRFCTNNWGDFVEITGGPDHVEYECIFPAMSKTMDNQLHITYMSDFEPGLAVRGDGDPYTVNSIMHLTIDKTDFGCIVNVHETNISGTVNIYPNPVTESMSVTFAKSSVVKMIIYNALGSVVMSNTFAVNKGDIKEVNISNLSSGIYMAKFQTTDGTFSKKIIKK